MIGATLDRNGLRPGRWLETKDGWVVLASETGVLDDPGRERPAQGPPPARARSSSSTSSSGRIVEDEEIKREIATRQPYGEWFEQGVVAPATTCPSAPPRVPRVEPLRSRQLAFGYTQEDLRVILAPLARNAEEPIGSMGNDLAARRALRPAAAPLLATSSSSSRRSRTRRSTRCARRS